MNKHNVCGYSDVYCNKIEDKENEISTKNKTESQSVCMLMNRKEK